MKYIYSHTSPFFLFTNEIYFLLQLIIFLKAKKEEEKGEGNPHAKIIKEMSFGHL